jgi:hypothetical protein
MYQKPRETTAQQQVADGRHGSTHQRCAAREDATRGTAVWYVNNTNTIGLGLGRVVDSDVDSITYDMFGGATRTALV